jgi:uncharacterized repeat protein (TIGR01451 family)
MLCLVLGMRAASSLPIETPAAVPMGMADAALPSVPAVTIKTFAERLAPRAGRDHKAVQLLPADHVVPGDTIIYTIEVRNEGANPVDDFSFTITVPEHMVYVADSAVAPGAELSFSVDGGRSFDPAPILTVHGADGKQRPAVAADYTTIRWTLRNRLKSGSMVLARYRAMLR